jgi:flagellar FliL protein
MAEAVKEKVEESKGAAPEAPAAEKKSGGFMKMLIAFAVIQVILAVGAFFAVKMVLLPKLQAAQPTAAEAKKAEAKVVEKPKEIVLIENLIVNPAGTNGTRYLSTSIGLEVEKEAAEGGAKGEGESKGEGDGKSAENGRMKAMTPVIRDILIAILSSRTLEELSSVEGKEIVRKEILEKVQLALGDIKLSKVYFVDYVLQ